ncbi:MAG: hypothetical protein E7658_08995 [Ruminococcaceae bacterium]|nr:hypothetical protein [Oscillospiraceae bacterium]
MERIKKKKKENETSCDSCMYYDTDPDTGEYVCTAAYHMDEDDVLGLRKVKNCPYYRFYHEYLSVRKQN